MLPMPPQSNPTPTTRMKAAQSTTEKHSQTAWKIQKPRQSAKLRKRQRRLHGELREKEEATRPLAKRSVTCAASRSTSSFAARMMHRANGKWCVASVGTLPVVASSMVTHSIHTIGTEVSGRIVEQYDRDVYCRLCVRVSLRNGRNHST